MKTLLNENNEMFDRYNKTILREDDRGYYPQQSLNYRANGPRQGELDLDNDNPSVERVVKLISPETVEALVELTARRYTTTSELDRYMSADYLNNTRFFNKLTNTMMKTIINGIAHETDNPQLRSNLSRSVEAELTKFNFGPKLAEKLSTQGKNFEPIEKEQFRQEVANLFRV